MDQEGMKVNPAGKLGAVLAHYAIGNLIINHPYLWVTSEAVALSKKREKGKIEGQIWEFTQSTDNSVQSQS